MVFRRFLIYSFEYIKSLECCIGMMQNPNRKTREQFIKDAIAMHGNKFDYSKVVYISNADPVIIICPNHGEFLQTPKSHLRKSNNGCRQCSYFIRSSNRKLSKEQFIEKSIKVHGNKYDYSSVKYLTSQTPVEIICLLHGSFWQTPISHYYNGSGCINCSSIHRLSTEEFIEKATYKHGDKYDYSLVEYNHSTENVCIVCRLHGKFWQKASNHLSGNGCFKCSRITSVDKKRLTTDIFIERARQIYNDLYDYSKVNYVATCIPVIIICKEHGEFLKRPGSHLRGQGCTFCSFRKHHKYSTAQILWLKFMELYHGVTIQHAENNIEYKIPNTPFKADGYCAETNTIYEFYGDFWHGNPKVFEPNKLNRVTKCTFNQLYNATMTREDTIRNLGYNVVSIWEYDWNMINRHTKLIQKEFRKFRKAIP
jgi:hypothetical protein